MEVLVRRGWTYSKYVIEILMGSRERLDLLSKFRAWIPWEKAEEKGRGREGSRKKKKTHIAQ